MLGQSRVLTKWEEEVETRGLGTLEVENLGVKGNAPVGTIGEDLISQGFVEGEPLRAWGKYMRVCVCRTLAPVAILQLWPVPVLEGDLPEDFLLLEAVLAVEPRSVAALLAR